MLYIGVNNRQCIVYTKRLRQSATTKHHGRLGAARNSSNIETIDVKMRVYRVNIEKIARNKNDSV